MPATIRVGDSCASRSEASRRAETQFGFSRRALQIRRARAHTSAAMADEYALDAVVEHVRPFMHVLSALRLSKKQLVRVGVSDRGVTFVAVDDSKSLQAQANFRAETFAAFSANPAAAFLTRDGSARAAISSSASFDVSLGALIDVLNVFAPLDGETTVSVRWPDRDGNVVLAAAAERDGARPSDAPVRHVTHASISPQDEDVRAPLNAELVFRGERNAFMVPTTTLKEIVDDLEWPSGGSASSGGGSSATSITMTNAPEGRSLTFESSSKETGSLRVEVDVPGEGFESGKDHSSCLSEFQCDAPGTWRYRHRFLRAATAVPAHLLVAPHGRGRDGDTSAGHHDGLGGAGAPTTTRVAIGEGGMLKVVHLIRVARASPAMLPGGGGATGATAGTRGEGTHGHSAGVGSENLTYSARGMGGRGSVVVPITFVAYPEEEEEDGDDE
jgi:cell cycle checkpoint protein